MAMERTVFAEQALADYRALANNYADTDTPAEFVQEITETDAFAAGWDAAVDHLKNVADDLDIPAPLKAIIKDMLDANAAELPVKD